MKKRKKQILVSIKSIIELGENLMLLQFFINKLTDKSLKKTIVDEIKKRNFGKLLLVLDNALYDLEMNSIQFEQEDIKQFECHSFEKINIAEIKKILEIENLPLTYLKDKDGKQTKYLWYFNTINRYGVIIENSLMEEIKQNLELLLNLNGTIVLAHLGYYTKFNIEKYTNKQTSNSPYTHSDYNSSDWLSDAAGSFDAEVMNEAGWNMD